MFSGDMQKKMSFQFSWFSDIIQHIDPHGEKNWPTLDIYGPKHMLKTKIKVSQRLNNFLLLFVKKQKNK